MNYILLESDCQLQIKKTILYPFVHNWKTILEKNKKEDNIRKEKKVGIKKNLHKQVFLFFFWTTWSCHSTNTLRVGLFAPLALTRLE